MVKKNEYILLLEALSMAPGMRNRVCLILYVFLKLCIICYPMIGLLLLFFCKPGNNQLVCQLSFDNYNLYLQNWNAAQIFAC